MLRSFPVSRPAWANVLSGLSGGQDWKSPVEIVASASLKFTRTPYARARGIQAGRFGRWADGVTAMRADRAAFAAYWREHNQRVLDEMAEDPGPLWVALGDSTAQGLGASAPDDGYVGQVLAQLRRATGQPWRVLNLSVSGSLVRDVIADQLPCLPAAADLVTCGAGFNDIFYSSPGRLFADVRALVAKVPDGTVMLDLPVPSGLVGVVGWMSVPYVTRINRLIHEAAAARGLPVAGVSGTFTAPWPGKFAGDAFHPSRDGYRDWASALLDALPAVRSAA